MAVRAGGQHRLEASFCAQQSGGAPSAAPPHDGRVEQIANLLWLHGGGWHSRSTEDGAALAEHGLRVVEGRYRLTGEAHWPG